MSRWSGPNGRERTGLRWVALTPGSVSAPPEAHSSLAANSRLNAVTWATPGGSATGSPVIQPTQCGLACPPPERCCGSSRRIICRSNMDRLRRPGGLDAVAVWMFRSKPFCWQCGARHLNRPLMAYGGSRFSQAAADVLDALDKKVCTAFRAEVVLGTFAEGVGDFCLRKAAVYQYEPKLRIRCAE